jgi:hypothetical protein
MPRWFEAAGLLAGRTRKAAPSEALWRNVSGLFLAR